MKSREPYGLFSPARDHGAHLENREDVRQVRVVLRLLRLVTLQSDLHHLDDARLHLGVRLADVVRRRNDVGALGAGWVEHVVLHVRPRPWSDGHQQVTLVVEVIGLDVEQSDELLEVGFFSDVQPAEHQQRVAAGRVVPEQELAARELDEVADVLVGEAQRSDVEICAQRLL
eukprot:TRINITY_DN7378_c0_g1_i1.p1 TRINITY_DN7378_c0_g1~~TRINITY_DN7378_c0_g1_i1.p1  ORF type:complete len:172 (+),score=26.85 TRINITY_DN7378_c0_g1_i1:208-723(+)